MLRFDHAIIAVAKLEPAIADFKALGFNAFYGGQHADGKTHNALVVFADGSYLELLAPTNPDFMSAMDTVDLSSFLDFAARGDGWAGFALLAEDIEAVADAMRKRELPVSDPIANSRQRPDGKTLAWRTLSIDRSRTPFIITDDTPRVLRVPDDADKISHTNGATGVAGITIAVLRLDRGVERYGAILGAESGPGPAVDAAETASFTLGDFRVSLAAPITFSSPLHEYIKQRGEVPFEITLRTNRVDQTGLLNVKRAHGARIELAG